MDRRLGFGIFLAPFHPVVFPVAHNWAGVPETLRRDELIARSVIPRFRGDTAGRPSSMEWSSANCTELMEAGRQANVVATQKHEAERRGRAGA